MKSLLGIGLSWCLASSALAEDLQIMTSFPSEMTKVFQDLWEEQHPGTALRILNKNTVSAVEEIQRGNPRAFDLFWASSPEAFVFLQRDTQFVEGATCGEDGPEPVEGFAISSVGWSKRSDSTLFMPGDWNDLLLPIYRDQIAMARPARSGTTHLLVEQVLQVRGWDDGWAYLLELSGNLSTLTARSYGVPDGVLNRRFEIGLMLDFLALSRGEVLQFRYGRPMMTVAAQIGILKSGRNPALACEFVKLLLSQQGQRALLEPQVARIPIDAQIRAEVSGSIPPEIIAGLKLPWLEYDPEASADRYWAVNALFDLMITNVLVERRTLWRRYRALQNDVNAESRARVRRLLTVVPVEEAEAVKVSGYSETGLRPAVQVDLDSIERNALEQWQLRVMDVLKQASDELDRLESELSK